MVPATIDLTLEVDGESVVEVPCAWESLKIKQEEDSVEADSQTIEKHVPKDQCPNEPEIVDIDTDMTYETTLPEGHQFTPVDALLNADVDSDVMNNVFPLQKDANLPQSETLNDEPQLTVADHAVSRIHPDIENNMILMIQQYNASTLAGPNASSNEEQTEAIQALEQAEDALETAQCAGEDTAAEELEVVRCLGVLERLRDSVRDPAEKIGDANFDVSSMFFPEDEEQTETSPAPPLAGISGLSGEGYVDATSVPTHRRKYAKREGHLIASGRVEKGKNSKGHKGGQGRRSGRGPGRLTGWLDMDSLIRDDIVGNAQHNQGYTAPEVVTNHRNKAKALRGLIQSIPANQRKAHNSDMTAMKDATKVFRCKGQGSMRAGESGGWLLKGMATELRHFQLISTAWGVNRERGNVRPYGGILADTMGYGKTIQAITIMVENRPKPGAKNITTLIVCPTNICDQWRDEITRHTEDNIMEKVLVYKSGSKFGPTTPMNSVIGQLRSQQVVVTTYHEVMANLPKCQIPSDFTSDNEKDTWWRNHYERTRGPLLRIPFHRVILDEAQNIKNPESRTSQACQLLTSKYKWVLTGTPLSNCMEEFYPYFKFLGVIGASNSKQFKENYAERTDITNRRLEAQLRTIMTRRTGTDRILGKPLVVLPSLDHETITLSFNVVERGIYQIVRQRFVERLNECTGGGKSLAIRSNIFVMLLRLRQMCAHVLMVSTAMRDMLTTDDLQKLWNLADGYIKSPNKRQSQIANVLKVILRDANEMSGEGTSISQHRSPECLEEQQTTVDLDLSSESFDYRGLFYKWQQDGKLLDIQSRSRCLVCGRAPTIPKLAAPCGHLYCEDCIITLMQSAEIESGQAMCSSCMLPIQAVTDMTAMNHIASKASSFVIPEETTDDIGNNHGIKKKKKVDPDMTWLQIPGAHLMSTKAQAVTNTLEEWITSNPKTKIVVFTLWIPITKVLNKICAQKGWPCVLYTGQQSINSRNRDLARWKDPEQDGKVLIMSLRAGGVGLNLTEANYAIIIDPWWNEPVEAQAFSRIYRIGQKNGCYVKRFVIKDTIDTQLMHHLQKLKKEECDSIVDGRVDQFTTAQLIELFAAPEEGAGGLQGDQDTGSAGDFVSDNQAFVVVNSDDETTVGAPSRPVES